MYKVSALLDSTQTTTKAALAIGARFCETVCLEIEGKKNQFISKSHFTHITYNENKNNVQ